jgi:hypothetical protein
MRRSTPWASDLAGAALSMGTCRGGTVPFSVLGMDVRAVRFLIEHGVYHRLNCPISGLKWDSLNACSQPARRGSGGDPDSADRRLPADGGTGVDARSSPTQVEILDGQVYPQHSVPDRKARVHVVAYLSLPQRRLTPCNRLRRERRSCAHIRGVPAPESMLNMLRQEHAFKPNFLLWRDANG